MRGKASQSCKSRFKASYFKLGFLAELFCSGLKEWAFTPFSVIMKTGVGCAAVLLRPLTRLMYGEPRNPMASFPPLDRFWTTVPSPWKQVEIVFIGGDFPSIQDEIDAIKLHITWQKTVWSISLLGLNDAQAPIKSNTWNVHDIRLRSRKVFIDISRDSVSYNRYEALHLSRQTWR
jgi:hypothetical protein